MFLLLSEVRLAKHLDIAAVARSTNDRMVATLRSAWAREASA